MTEIPESDWRRLRQLKETTLERFCERVLHEVAKITATQRATHRQRYRDLYQFLHEQDQELALAFDDQKRSTALSKIAKIYALGLFTDEEFADFSDDTRARVAVFNSI